jgi:hypothetical protein
MHGPSYQKKKPKITMAILFLQFDYQNSVLAVAGTDSALEFWFPRSS